MLMTLWHNCMYNKDAHEQSISDKHECPYIVLLSDFNRSAMVFTTPNHSLFNPTLKLLFPHPSTPRSSYRSCRHRPTSFSRLKF